MSKRGWTLLIGLAVVLSVLLSLLVVFAIHRRQHNQAIKDACHAHGLGYHYWDERGVCVVYVDHNGKPLP